MRNKNTTRSRPASVKRLEACWIKGCCSTTGNSASISVSISWSRGSKKAAAIANTATAATHTLGAR